MPQPRHRDSEIELEQTWATGIGDAMLVLPTINGTKAFGFAESRPGHGEIWVRGVVQFAPAEAVCVQDLVERGEPLSYSGPVWHDGRWMTDTFPIELIDVRAAVGAGVLVGFTVVRL